MMVTYDLEELLMDTRERRKNIKSMKSILVWYNNIAQHIRVPLERMNCW